MIAWPNANHHILKDLQKQIDEDLVNYGLNDHWTILKISSTHTIWVGFSFFGVGFSLFGSQCWFYYYISVPPFLQGDKHGSCLLILSTQQSHVALLKSVIGPRSPSELLEMGISTHVSFQNSDQCKTQLHELSLSFIDLETKLASIQALGY